MNRRELLTTAGLGAVALASAKTFAASTAAATTPPSDTTSSTQALAAAAAECVNTGSACLQHCLNSLATGDKMMAACAKTVADMLAQTRALVDLANANSRHLKAAAKLSADIAKDCEVECKKHEAMSSICKRCAETCTKLIAAASKV